MLHLFREARSLWVLHISCTVILDSLAAFVDHIALIVPICFVQGIIFQLQLRRGEGTKQVISKSGLIKSILIRGMEHLVKRTIFCSLLSAAAKDDVVIGN